MLLWIRTPRASREAKPEDALRQDVHYCARVLVKCLLPLAKRYSLQVLIPALCLQLRGLLNRCLREGLITSSQARTMVDSILDSPGEGDLTT